MNILVLSNAARGCYRFFSQLAENFKSDGDQVVIAVDCEYSKYVNYLDETCYPILAFADLFSSHQFNRNLSG